MTRRESHKSLTLRAGVALCLGAVVFSLSSCKMEEITNTAKDRIFAMFNSEKVYERGNVPENTTTINGYFDIIDGAYRHIANEDRPGREAQPPVAAGDSISFRFDFRIFSGSFANSATFFTNIETVRDDVRDNNPDFDTAFWPIVPLKIKVGNDPGILKSIQTALIDCRAYDDKVTDDKGTPIASDEVRIYLPPNVAFGGRRVYNVPANSTLVIAVTDIRITYRIN